MQEGGGCSCMQLTAHEQLSAALLLLLPHAQAEVARELAARKCFLQGCDSQGHPVLVVWAARHDMGDRHMGETKRFIGYCLDNAIAAADAARHPGAQIKCLFDLSGAPTPGRCSAAAGPGDVELWRHCSGIASDGPRPSSSSSSVVPKWQFL